MIYRYFRPAVLALAAAASVGAFAASDRPSSSSTSSSSQKPQTAIKISIEIAGTAISATLDDTPTARDFASLLPLSVTLEDYSETEKVSQLPRRLSIEGAPEAITPKAGELAYYEPWGNLAIFHKDFRRSPRLVRLGTLDSGIELMRQRGPLKVTIRKYGQ